MDQINIFRRATEDTHALSIGLSILAAVVILLVALVLVKLIYLKYRRIRMIHNLQAMLSPSSLEVSELGASTPDQRGRTRERQRNGLHRDLLVDIDPLGPSTRSWGRQSKCPSRASNDSQRVASPAPSPTPGLLVGLLGSPAWETRMRRELDDHRWRQQRRATVTVVDILSPSDPSQQTLQTTVRSFTPTASRPSSRESQNQSYLPSQPSNRSQQSQLSAPRTLPRRRPRSAHFHNERRTVTRVTSFGELEVEEVNVRMRRPQSLSAVVDQAMAARLIPQKQTQPQQRERTRPLSDGRVQLDHSARSRPSPIVEEVPSPVPSVGLNRALQRAISPISPDGTSQTCVEEATIRRINERDVGLGFRPADHQDIAARSDVDLSVANSMSFGQLRQFPDPPEQAIALAVHVPTVDFDKLEMSWRLSGECDFPYKLDEELHSFVDLKPDFPSCHYLLRGATPYSDIHTLSCPLSSTSDSSSTTLRNSCDCDYLEHKRSLDQQIPTDLDITDSRSAYEPASDAVASLPSCDADFQSQNLPHSSSHADHESLTELSMQEILSQSNDQTPTSASSRRLAFVVSMASSRSSLTFRSVSGRYSFSLATGASVIMGQPEDAALVTSPSTGRLSVASKDDQHWSPRRMSLFDQLVSRRHTLQTPKTYKDADSRNQSSLITQSAETTDFSVDPGKESRPLSLQDVQEDEMLVLREQDEKLMCIVHPRKLVFLRDSQFKPFERPSISRQSSWEIHPVEVVRPDSIADDGESPVLNNEEAVGLYPAPVIDIIEEEPEEVDLGLVSLSSLHGVPDNGAPAGTNIGLGLGPWDALFSDGPNPATGLISLTSSSDSAGSSCGFFDTGSSSEESTAEF